MRQIPPCGKTCLALAAGDAISKLFSRSFQTTYTKTIPITSPAARYSETGKRFQLTQQLAGGHWSLQQISVQQSNMQSLINAATAQLTASVDALTALITLAPHAKRSRL
jgi:hypothetical protein